MSGRSVALAALSGLLLAASFPPFGLPFLAWIALVPLFAALRGLTPQQGLCAGFAAGIVHFIGTISWVFNALRIHGGVSLVPALLITLMLCAYCALYPALFGAIVARLHRTRPALVILAAPAAWTALELARAHVFSGFPWALLGHSQAGTLTIIQIADITGVYGVSCLLVLVNNALAVMVQDRRRTLPLLAAAAVAGSAAAYGLHRLAMQDGESMVRIAVIQGNIEQDRKWDPAYRSAVISTYKRLTREAAERKPDLIIWPETATPFYFGGSDRTDAEMTEDLRRFVRGAGIPLLAGSPEYERRPDRTHALRNSAFLLGADGGTSSRYHKLHLVPFGEYIPFKQALFFVEKIVRASGDFQAGSEHTVMQVQTKEGRDTAVSTVICYEIIFPGLVRRFVNKGAVIMAAITNDAWFGRSGAPSQHFAMAVFRAVENRVPVARAANTGISGFIDAQGRILGATDIFTEAVLVRDLVPAAGATTFYTRYGDVFGWLCVLASLALLARSAGSGLPVQMHADEDR